MSVVVPSLRGGENLERLLDTLRAQDCPGMEAVVVRGVTPQGRAINMGAAASSGEFLIVVDDDSRLPDPTTVRRLVEALEDPSVGMAGASTRCDPALGRFAAAVARSVPRFEVPVVERTVDSDMACHGCCGFRKDVFLKVGGEREDIPRGLDPDLRRRLREAGYRVVLAAGAWYWHDPPATLRALWRTFRRNGRGSALVGSLAPGLALDTSETVGTLPPATPRARWRRGLGLLWRVVSALLTLRPLRAVAYVAYALGYVAGLREAAWRRRTTRVVCATADFPPLEGGVSELAFQVVRRLARSRKVVVVAPRGDGAGVLDGREAYAARRVPGYGLGYARFFPMAAGVDLALLTHRPGFFIAFSMAHGALPWYLSFLQPRGRLVVWAYGYEFCKVAGTPLASLYRRIYGRAAAVVAVSRFTADLLKEFGVPAERIRVILPGADLSRFRLSPEEREAARRAVRERLGIGPSAPVLLTVGRLVRRKGHDTVLRALPRVLERLPDCVYLVAGDGPERGRLEALSRRLGLAGHVRFLGRVSDDDLPGLYAASDLFCMVSRNLGGRDVEGFGIVYIEAAACGLPSVAGDEGGPAEAVLHGETGLLVPARSPSAVADAALSLLSDPARRRALGEAARRRALTHFSWDRVAREFEELLRELEGPA